MADTIKIGNLDISAFKVGSSDCKIYLGDTLLYPQSQPQVKDYFRFVAREDKISFKLSGNTIDYSLDSGTTWTSLASDTDSPLLSSGETIMFKATNPTIDTDNGIGRFYTSGGTFDVEGNIMSLLYGDNFEGQTALQGDSQFRGLFDSNTKVINASGLTLPATAMTANCYRSMFGNCSNLESAPTELPATSLADSCYRYMYAKTKVANAPSTLPATTLADNCYRDMFREAYFTTAPSLPATTLATYCYYQMFRDCTNLTTAPTLPATSLAQSCYANMFQGCTSLTTAPILSATTLQSQCYEYMFNGCTSLTTAPELPATSLATSCYAYMFQGCTSLTTAPILSATTLQSQCYRCMFYGCTSLNYIKCLATDISASYCTESWVYNVAASGTFIRAEGMRSWNGGYSGIPRGWLALPSYYFAITSLADNNTITLRNNSRLASATTFSYSLDNGVTWTDFSLTSGQTKTIATINSGDTIHLKGSNNTLASNYNYGHYFRGSGDYEISGEISSLINGNDYDTKLSESVAFRYAFAQLFSGDTHLVSAENLFVDSETLPQDCFNGTFRDCTSLTAAPELPSTRLNNSCYSSMFEGCIALSKVPSEIRFTYVGGSQVFQRMFCMSRTSKVTTPAMTESPKLFGDWGATTPTNQQMFCGNGNLNKVYCYWTRTSGSFSMTNWVNYTADSGVTFYKRSTATFASGVNGIKTGWTVVNDDSTT